MYILSKLVVLAASFRLGSKTWRARVSLWFYTQETHPFTSNDLFIIRLPASVAYLRPRLPHTVAQHAAQRVERREHLRQDAAAPREDEGAPHRLHVGGGAADTSEPRRGGSRLLDVTKLLRAVRGALYEKAEALGANVLVDELRICLLSSRGEGGTDKAPVLQVVMYCVRAPTSERWELQSIYSILCLCGAFGQT
ncbi:hypothetical protein A0H81_12699 [Grifola frondosa]|uniref:Uncharacterized protein n=1 Tax=Grifola frondosa TaxID=5627 RepID=A0A1C7LRT1_GRIFR|nr:hypothetical protein A0H81_12699 [Grifola frondosa]